MKLTHTHTHTYIYIYIFGIKKTKCMIAGKNPFHDLPIWKLGDKNIDIEDQLEILGTTFSSSMSYHSHVNKRCQASRRAMCGLASIGCCYPGFSTEVKVHLWKTVGLPTLLYGMENLELRAKDLRELEKLQSSIVKRTTGLPLHCHHTHLLIMFRSQTSTYRTPYCLFGIEYF